MIDVRNLTRRFGQLTAVDDISFELQKGEVVGFLGPNGAGKTTAMRMLTGYLPATSAACLEVAGHDVLRESMEVRKRIGYLPESVPLYRELRVREMLLFQGRLHGMSRAELRTRVPEILERVGILDREKQLVGKLSRGLRQRAGLAVALLPKPEVLILDEPTSGLDPIQRLEVREVIRSLADDHTVLLSSHILAEVESVCPRVLVISAGKIVADGSQAKLVESMAGSGHVILEAMVGDAAEAQRLLTSLPGVSDVSIGERVGIHQAFEIHGAGDLREDVGALAMTKGWALRELTWKRPSLEELFARLILGGDFTAASSSSSAPAPAAGMHVAEPAGAGLLQMSQPASAPAAPPAAPSKTIYSLNPFDQGASRNLGAPMKLGEEPPAEPRDDCEK